MSKNKKIECETLISIENIIGMVKVFGKAEYQDLGIGNYEFWGANCTDVNWQWVCEDFDWAFVDAFGNEQTKEQLYPETVAIIESYIDTHTEEICAELEKQCYE